MNGTRKFSFLGYELREATPDDLPLATEWTKADPEHNGSIDPDFWIQAKRNPETGELQHQPMKLDPGAERWVLTDRHGAVFFFRIEKAVRVYIQFGPNKTSRDRDRNGKAMECGFKWLATMLAMRSVREIVFDSRVDALRAFCGRRLGFKQKASTLTKRIPLYTPSEPAAQTTDKAPQGVTA